MFFNSRPEAYSYALYCLDQIPIEHVKQDAITSIQCAIENHEQNADVVITMLRKILKIDELTDENKLNIARVIQMMLNCAYQQTLEEKFETPWMRRLESDLAIALLLHPTKAMMHSVGLVSKQIIYFLRYARKMHNQALTKSIREFYDTTIDSEARGDTSVFDVLIKYLEENHSNELITILKIHYFISHTLIRIIPFNCPVLREPVGELKNIVQKIWRFDPATFFTEKEIEDLSLQFYIANDVMYQSPLYRSYDKKRGRKGFISPEVETTTLGIMLVHQKDYEENIPSLKEPWLPDCKNQLPDFASPHVLDLIHNDTPYVSGYSGMTSLFLNTMELSNLESVPLKQNYLSAIASYIVGLGLHSWHEVLGPAEYLLKLIPGYQVSVPDMNKLARPPNYHAFVLQQSKIDPEFESAWANGWRNYHEYLKLYFSKKSEPLLIPEKDPSISEEKLCSKKNNINLTTFGLPSHNGLFKLSNRAQSAPSRLSYVR